MLNSGDVALNCRVQQVQALTLLVVLILSIFPTSGCDKKDALEGTASTDAMVSSKLCLSASSSCVAGKLEFEVEQSSPAVASGALVYVEGRESVSTRADSNGSFMLPLMIRTEPASLSVVDDEISATPVNKAAQIGKSEAREDESFAQKPFTIVAIHDSDGKKFANRIPNLFLGSAKGLDLGKLSLKETGAMEGQVTLSDGASALGVDVYIPGTSFVAKADDEGRFVILYIPEGEYSLVFEKSGYFYESLGGIRVQSKQVARLKGVSLSAQDLKAPSTTIDRGPPLISNQQLATFEMTSSEASSQFLCRLDSGKFEGCNTPISFVRLGEGDHVLDVKAVDSSGNVDSVGATYRWRVDLSAPILTVEEKPASVTRNTTARFRFDTSDSDALFACLHNGAFIECASEFELNNLSQGSHLLQVSVADAAGNWSLAKVFLWQVDLVDPDTIALQSPLALSNSTSATIQFTSNKPSTFLCSYNGSTAQACSSPLTYTNLSNGIHLLEIKAVDATGAADTTPLLMSWEVDAVSPAVPVPTAIAGNLTNDATPNLNWNQGMMNLEALIFDIEIDISPSFNSTQLRTFAKITSTQQTVVPQLTDGVWYFRVRASDTAGNTSAWSAALNFTLDTVPADIPVGHYLPDPYNDPRPLFSWNAIVGANQYRVQIAGDAHFNDPFIDLSNIAAISFRPAANLPSGAIFWRVASVDIAGNQSNFSQPRLLTIDTSAPTPPTANTLTTPTSNRRPTFSWSAVAGVSNYRVQVSTSSEFSSMVIDDASITAISFTPDADFNDNLYYWRVASIDGAQNLSGYSQSQSFVIDTSAPPAPTLIAYPSPNNDLTPTLQWLNPGAGATLYDLQILQGSTMLVNASGLTQLEFTPTSPLPIGATTWKVRAKDSAGNTGSWSTIGSFTLTSAATWRLKALGERVVLPAPGYLREHTDGTVYAFPKADKMTWAPSVFKQNAWNVRAQSEEGDFSSYRTAPFLTSDGTGVVAQHFVDAHLKIYQSTSLNYWSTIANVAVPGATFATSSRFIIAVSNTYITCEKRWSVYDIMCMITDGNALLSDEIAMPTGYSPTLVGMNIAAGSIEPDLLVLSGSTGLTYWLRKTDSAWGIVTSASLNSVSTNWRTNGFRYTSDGRPIISTSNVDKDYVWNGSEFQYITAVEAQGKTIATGTNAVRNTGLQYFDGTSIRIFPIEEDSGAVLTEPFGETHNNRFGLPVAAVKYIDTLVHNVVPFVRITAIDVAPHIGKYNSLTFASDGTPRIAYYDASTQKLKLAEKVSGNWTANTIDNGTNVGKHSSIALKSDGKAVIAYFDDATADLKVATEGASSWITETIDFVGDVGRNASLVVGSDDHPRIAYHDETNGNLKFARYTGIGWDFEVVDSSSHDVGEALSLALDASNNPHIAYYDATAGTLRYASYDGSEWSNSLLDNTANVGSHLSLALKSNGHAMIAYYDATNADLKFVEWSGSTWSHQTLRSTGDVGQFVSLTLGSANEPHVCFYDATNKRFVYGNRDTNWAFRTIDGDESNGHDRGQWTSIKINPINQSPSAVYYDSVEGGIRFVEGMVLY